MTIKHTSIKSRGFWLVLSAGVLFTLWYGWTLAVSVHLTAADLIWPGLALDLHPLVSPVAFLIAGYLFCEIRATEHFRLLPLQALRATACRSLFEMLVHLACSIVAFSAVFLAVLLTSALERQAVVAIVGLSFWTLAVIYFFAFGGPTIKQLGERARRLTLKFQ